MQKSCSCVGLTAGECAQSSISTDSLTETVQVDPVASLVVLTDSVYSLMPSQGEPILKGQVVNAWMAFLTPDVAWCIQVTPRGLEGLVRTHADINEIVTT